MIFILHYILINAGLPAILILIALYLQTWSDASLSEIGTLLMVLPFVSIIIKPLFCALADRQQAHKGYLMVTCLFILLGYGSLIIYPFYPDFIKEHGRLVWFLECLGVIVGYSAFGIVWSLGDALAVNAARVRGIPWGSYRVWGTLSWGVFGYLIGQINEVAFLPKYSPALMLLVVAMLIEILLLAFWPNADFDMSREGPAKAGELEDSAGGAANGFDPRQQKGLEEQQQRAEANERTSLAGTLRGTARLNARLVGAVANVLAEDIGQSLRSSLKLGAPRKRPALADVLAEHAELGSGAPIDSAALSLASQQVQPAQQQPPQHTPVYTQTSLQLTPITGGAQQPFANHPRLGQLASGQLEGAGNAQSNSNNNNINNNSPGSRSGTLTGAAIRRAQMALSKMNSLSSASGHAIADDLTGYSPSEGTLNGRQRRQAAVMMSSLASSASLSRAAAERALGFSNTSAIKGSTESQLTSAHDQTSKQVEEGERQQRKSVEDLQMVLLKLIVKRDKNILKYLVMFTVYGILLTVHLTYFFLHVEKLCREKSYDFSNLTGIMLVAQSMSEIFGFTVLSTFYMPRVGRTGSIMTIGVIYFVRYAYYGTYFPELSPYLAIATETCHGFAYAIVYSLVTEIAIDSVDQVDLYLPELIERKIVDPSINAEQLKLPLRATMQGVYSGAFDGLGNGIGALLAGIYLDYYSFVSLWQCCALMSLLMIVLYPLTELRQCCSSGGRKR